MSDGLTAFPTQDRSPNLLALSTHGTRTTNHMINIIQNKKRKRKRTLTRRKRRTAGVALVLAGLAALLVPGPASAVTDNRYELVVQDGQYRYVVDHTNNAKAWAGHCTDQQLGATPTSVTWNDIKTLAQESTPDCTELERRLGTNSATNIATTTTTTTGSTGSVDGRPVCSSQSADPDGDGWGWENGRTCVAPPPQPPATVVGLTVKGGVLVRWTGIHNAAGYNVYRNGDYVATVTGETEYRDLVVPGDYTYEVASFGPGGLVESKTRRRSTGKSLPSAVISVGDSFISGDGGRWIGNKDAFLRPNAYEPDTWTNKCRRSDVAPIRSAAIPGVKTFNIACSGAVAEAIYDVELNDEGELPDFKGEGPQILQLREHGETHHLDMVVVSIGGNDMGFNRLVEKCIKDYENPFRDECKEHRQAEFEGNLDSKMIPEARKAIKSVKAELHRLRQLEARVVLVSYPSSVPYETRWSDPFTKNSHGCPFHSKDLRWVNGDLVPRIDSEYEQLAKELDIEFVSMDSAFHGKEVCGKQVTANQNTSDPARYEWVVNVEVFDGEVRKLESIHPNAFGQQALGRCLNLAWQSPSAQYHKCFNNNGMPEDMRMVHRTTI